MLKKKFAIIIGGVFLVTLFGIGSGIISSNYSVYAKSKGKGNWKQRNFASDALKSVAESVTTTSTITTTSAITTTAAVTTASAIITTPSSISTTPPGIIYPQHMGKDKGKAYGKRKGMSNGNGRDGAPKLKGKDRADFVHKRNDERKAAMGHGKGKNKGNLKDKNKGIDNSDKNENENEIDD